MSRWLPGLTGAIPALSNHVPYARADINIHSYSQRVWSVDDTSFLHLEMTGNINLPPPGTNYIATISIGIQTLVIGHTFLVLLIPLLVALFYYSTPYSRRQPIFILNVLAITLAITAAIISDAMNIHILILPQYLWPARLTLAVGFIGIFQGMLVDTILLVRLITVHPLSRIGLLRFLLLTSLPVALKITRMVNLILYTNELSIIMATGSEYANAWLTLPYPKIEWVAQVVDNSYASIAFLWTIYYRRPTSASVSDSLISTVSFRQSSFAQRLRILFSFALSNFIIPTVMSLVQLILIFRIGASNSVLLNDINFVNAMVSVIGVVFATVWAGKEHRREAIISRNPDLPMARGLRPTDGLDGWRVASHIPANENYQDDKEELDLDVRLGEEVS